MLQNLQKCYLKLIMLKKLYVYFSGKRLLKHIVIKFLTCIIKNKGHVVIF